MEYLYSTHTFMKILHLIVFVANANENVVKQTERISAWHNMMKITIKHQISSE